MFFMLSCEFNRSKEKSPLLLYSAADTLREPTLFEFLEVQPLHRRVLQICPLKIFDDVQVLVLNLRRVFDRKARYDGRQDIGVNAAK
jgi:hypothetical protein